MPKRSKRVSWGGARPGSGRKPMPAGEVRRNRIVVMLNDDELATLSEIATQDGQPAGAVAYRLLSASLRQRRGV